MKSGSPGGEREPVRLSRTGSVLLDVRVKPRGRKSELLGWERGRLAVRLAAPPVDGKANRALVELLCRELGLGRSQVTLFSGEKSKDKTLEIGGLEPAELVERLKLLPPNPQTSS